MSRRHLESRCCDGSFWMRHPFPLMFVGRPSFRVADSARSLTLSTYINIIPGGLENTFPFDTRYFICQFVEKTMSIVPR